jgi:putrescine transport system substrate-binding protein
MMQRILAGLILAILALPPAARGAEEKVLNVYIWNDYITEAAVKSFTDKTGIKVVYDVYDSNDILEAKLVAGRSGYDVVFPSATPYFAKQIKAGVYRRLDRGKLSNFARLDAKVMAELAAADPEHAYGVPYMMAGTGVGYNPAKVRALMPDAPIGSLAMLFDPAIVAKLAPCGVTVLDGGDEVFAAALAFAGRNPQSTSPEDLKAAADVVAKVRPHYRYVHSSSYINDLANGATCVAMGYAGDLVQSRARAREAGRGIEVAIFLPREGAAFNIDVAAIPTDAPHPDNAHLFIDHLLSPAVIAEITSRIGYANAVPEAKPLVEERVRNDPVVFPPAETRLYTMPLVTPQFERERNRAWTRVRAAR